jgi:hypothetical protein
MSDVRHKMEGVIVSRTVEKEKLTIKTRSEVPNLVTVSSEGEDKIRVSSVGITYMTAIEEPSGRMAHGGGAMVLNRGESQVFVEDGDQRVLRGRVIADVPGVRVKNIVGQ